MKTNSNTPKKLYVGLDVHKEKTVIAHLGADRNDEPQDYKSVATTQHALEKSMRTLIKSKKLTFADLHVCYEASGCGFWIARRFLQMGILCEVIAPSLIPTKSGDRIKTDKRDAVKLSRNLRANELVPVNIPDSTDEAIRDLCRARTDAVDDLRRAKSRFPAFLRYHGYSYTGKTHWTEAHKRYLRKLNLPSPVLNLIMENNFRVIDEALDRIAKLEESMSTLLESWQRKPLVEAVMAFKGFKTVAAMVIVSEIGTFSRFAHPKKLMAYLGLVPTENTSSTKRKQGGITKCGNGHARWILIESATHYRFPPKISDALSKRHKGQEKWIRTISWKAQQRLHARFTACKKRKLHHNKTKVAVARELAAFLWELGTKIEAQSK
jgi:transposase